MEYDSLQVQDVLVPVDGSPAGFDALALACTLAKRRKGTVYAVYVIEVARNLALDAELAPEARHGEEVLTKSEDVAAELDYKVEGEILQARDAGHAIVDEAIERAVSAVVMGVDYETPLGEFDLGNTALYVIKHAPCQLVLLRAAARE
ncbi:MAG: universal stress protein [Dehalococcoidia bacterium]|nr:universal stress protein [Dehalococcoidia bacterium]